MGASHAINFNDHALLLKLKGVPASRLTTLLTVAMMLTGGILVLLDWHRQVGAGLLFIIMFLAAFVLHRFWEQTDAYTRLSEFGHMMKDLSLAGAALLLLS
jgi:uncharacterized membrane protein YphA (DoxX/SURF4 family)